VLGSVTFSHVWSIARVRLIGSSGGGDLRLHDALGATKRGVGLRTSEVAEQGDPSHLGLVVRRPSQCFWVQVQPSHLGRTSAPSRRLLSAGVACSSGAGTSTYLKGALNLFSSDGHAVALQDSPVTPHNADE
jgi:hypothetical protein